MITPASPRRCTSDQPRARSWPSSVVEVQGQSDVVVIGVPYLGPYNVNSVDQPDPGHLARARLLLRLLHRAAGRPEGRRGDPVPPAAGRLPPLHHPSYVDFFAEVLSTIDRPGVIEAEFEKTVRHRPLVHPPVPDLPRLPRRAPVLHVVPVAGATRWTARDIVWVGADRSSVERMGFRAASTLADALEMVVRRRSAARRRSATCTTRRRSWRTCDERSGGRQLAAWATARVGARRPRLRGTARTSVTSRGWRWGRRPLVPRSAESSTPPTRDAASSRPLGADPAGRSLREVVQVVGLETAAAHGGRAGRPRARRARSVDGPALIVANHASHLDTAVLLTSLPAEWRRRRPWRPRPTTSSTPGGGRPARRSRSTPSRSNGAAAAAGHAGRTAGRRLELVVYPEGTRSRDGLMGRFRMGAAWLAVRAPGAGGPGRHPGHLRGDAARRDWPVRGGPGSASATARRSSRDPARRPASWHRGSAPPSRADRRGRDHLVGDRAARRTRGRTPAASWRRIWQQTEAPVEGGKPRRTKIWRR